MSFIDNLSIFFRFKFYLNIIYIFLLRFTFLVIKNTIYYAFVYKNSLDLNVYGYYKISFNV